MWGAIVKFLGPIANWIAKVFLVPLIIDLVNQWKTAAEEKRKRIETEKQIDESIKKIAEATTPEETENALEDLVRGVRARKP